MSVSSALGDLSSSCQSGLTSLLSSPFATCANVLGLVNIASASGSIVTPLDTYIKGVCTTDPCSQSELSNASSIVTTSCQSDISSGSLIPTALAAIIDNYGGIRSLLCTKHTSNNTYCVTELLSGAQNSTGTQLSISTLSSLVTGNGYESFLQSIPKDVYCTDCGHAVTTEALAIVSNVSASAEPSIASAVSQQCGASFVDGSLPSGISTAGTSGVGSASDSGAGVRSLNLNSKTVAIIGTVSAVIAGVGITFA